MIRFDQDYTRGAHELILKKLVDTNYEQTPGYGTDYHCANASEYIRKACKHPDADIHFLVGGTQTNLTIISSILRPHQAVIAAETGHIATSETGAIEATGHKVLTIPTADGKITALQIKKLIEEHLRAPGRIHTPKPGMIFLAHSTETGGIYYKKELEEIKAVANEFDLPLFIDGARLGYAIAAKESDIDLADLAEICDVFYIGGTKVGALFGEAVVIMNERLKPDFRYIMKQRGALLAKGRLLGLQFEALFEDGLYLEISRQAVSMAMRIKEALIKKGIQLRYEAFTNQLFPVFSELEFKILSEKYILAQWSKENEHIVARICTDWSTQENHVEQFILDVENL